MGEHAYEEMTHNPDSPRLTYRMIRGLERVVIDTFFRVVEVIDDHRFPSGPTIVVANHSNQFMDAMMLVTNVSRPISFLIAEKSMHRPVIGHVARAMASVPVTRRKDIAFRGAGVLTTIQQQQQQQAEGEGNNQEGRAPAAAPVLVLTGRDTKFLSQLSPGSQLEVESSVLTVKAVVSDTEAHVSTKQLTEVQEALEEGKGEGKGVGFKVLPKVDHSAMFQHVYTTLERGGCIGIFPEGTSTDHTQMLQFQAGVAIMALEASRRDIPVRIQAVGLNYFHGHVWRSRAVMRFAEPLAIPAELVELSKANAAKASNDLLALIRERLESVTFQVPEFHQARIFHVARSLYAGDRQLSPLEASELSRRLAVAYNKLHTKPDVQDAFQQVCEYHNELQSLGLKESEVRQLHGVSKVSMVARLVWHALVVLVTWPFVFVGTLWASPIIFIAGRKAKEEMRKAKRAAPTTKQVGLDVVASKKVVVGIVLVPLFYLLYTVIGVVIAAVAFPSTDKDWTVPLEVIVLLCILLGFPVVLRVGLKANDRMRVSMRHVRALYTGLRRPKVKQHLQERRVQLQGLAKSLVDQYFPELEFQNRVLDFSDQGAMIQNFADALEEA